MSASQVVRREQFFLTEANPFLGKGTPWELVFSLFAWLLVCIVQFLYLNIIPGLHFDEAWAANFAYRIYQEPGFWPLHAQSPYTMPWSHYFAAIFFQLFGVSVLVFRLSQVFLAAIGILLLLRVLFRTNRARIALYFPFLLIAFPGMIINQRFAIELTGFHLFCAGLLVYGLSIARSKYWSRVGKVLALMAVFLGVSSHVLFLALPFALFFFHLWNSGSFNTAFQKEESFWIAGAGLSLLPFFVRIYMGVPEKGKAIALILGISIFSIWVLCKAPVWQKLLTWQKYWLWLPVLAGAVFLANAFFFWEGHWVILRQIGELQAILFFGTSLVVLLVLTVFYGWERLWAISDFRKLLQFLLLLCLFLGVLMLKQTPRYYHLSFVPITALLVLFLMQMRVLWRSLVIAFFLLHVGSSITANYFLPAVYGHQVDSDIQVLTFKDSSRDFLPKQHVVRYLGSLNCGLKDIKTSDSRVAESFKFLRHSDWPMSGGDACPASEIFIERAKRVLEAHESEQRDGNGMRLLQNGFYIDLIKKKKGI